MKKPFPKFSAGLLYNRLSFSLDATTKPESKRASEGSWPDPEADILGLKTGCAFHVTRGACECQKTKEHKGKSNTKAKQRWAPNSPVACKKKPRRSGWVLKWSLFST
jgi:hypothetical protein